MNDMIMGAHMVLYTRNAEADRAFFRDILDFPCVDAGHGWLIFAMPAAEAAFHPAEDNDRHEFYLMCDDLKREMARLEKKGIACPAPHTERWGTVTKIPLPGGGAVGLYQPAHPIAIGTNY